MLILQPSLKDFEQKQPLVKMNVKPSRRVAFSPYRETGGELRNKCFCPRRKKDASTPSAKKLLQD